MHLLIKDVLRLFQDKSVSLAAGSAGLENTVLSVNIMDAPDIVNWVKSGDLILTTAYIAKDDPILQERLIRDLVASGAAGLGIKTKRFLPEIPDIIKKVADELNFPILDLPLNLSLAEIMNPIISSIANKQSYLLQRSNEIHKTLTRVAIQGEGLYSIITCLGKLTQCPVGYYDTNGLPISHWLPETIPGVNSETLKQFDEFLNKKIKSTDILQGILSQTKLPYTQTFSVAACQFFLTSFPVMSNNEFFGHISIIQINDAFSDINCIALEQACIIAALDFSKQKAISQSRRLHSRDILDHLLSDDLAIQNMAENLAGSRLMQAKFFECLVIEVDESEAEVNIPLISTRLYKTTQQIVTTKHPLSLVSERIGKVIALVASTCSLNTHELHLSTLLQKSFQSMYNNLQISIGVGTLVSDLNSVRQSYLDALTCLRLGRKVKGNGQVTLPYEIASYTVLTSPQNSSMLSHVCNSIIEKLERCEKSSGTEFLRSLEKYLECDKSLTETSNELYIHRNTLSNRLEKITDIVNLDFNNKELIFCLRLALRQRRII